MYVSGGRIKCRHWYYTVKKVPVASKLQTSQHQYHSNKPPPAPPTRSTHTMVFAIEPVDREPSKKMVRISNTTFIHFNDIYNADKAAPFVSSTKNCRRDLQSSSSEEVDDGHRRRRDVFTFFSGDVFSPSILSTFFRGEQMLPVLNALDIDCACLGMYIL